MSMVSLLGRPTWLPWSIRARMRTSPDRVPADGSRVVVFTDLDGDIHIELDAVADTVFEPEQRYTAAE